ncbi:MAG: tyrosine-type recombinase/integrase [Anaerolineales bacterium]|nr:tyrosine-type recombinase/integrase [Anaerolineales bacterium]
MSTASESNSNALPQSTLDSESELFLKTAGGGQSPHTARTYHQGLAQFKNYLQQTQNWTDARPIAELTPEMLQELPAWLLKQTYQRNIYTAPTPLAESTRALYLLAVTRLIRFLVLRKRLPAFDYAEYNRIKEELAQATRVKNKPVAQKIPSQEIVEALTNAARLPPAIEADAPPAYQRRLNLIWRRNLAIILALKSSGMRVGELVSLKRGDLDDARRGAWVTGKGRKTRFVAFDDEAWTAMQTYLVDRQDESLMVQIAVHPLFCRHDRSVRPEARFPLTTRSIQYLIDQLAEQADIARRFSLSPHSLRHFFANGLLEFTGNLALVQEALGHQDPKTTRVYTKVGVDQIAASVRAMSQRSDTSD